MSSVRQTSVTAPTPDHSAPLKKAHTLPDVIAVIDHDHLENLKAIHRGSFGVLCRASHKDFGDVAYKELDVKVMRTGDKVSRELLREAQSNVLRHENIACMLAVVYEPSHYGVVMEYAIHGGLDTFLVSYKVGWLAKLRLATDVACGVNYIHTHTEPVIHGELKAHHVLIGDRCIAKICDFGLSKWKQFVSMTKSARPVLSGTITHIPPESWKNINAKRTTKYDVYSFSILLWELMTGQHPFEDCCATPSGTVQCDNTAVIKAAVVSGQRPPIRLVNSNDLVSEQTMVTCVQSLIEKCWHQEPNDRPTFGEIRNTLEQILNEREADVCEVMADLESAVSSASQDC